MGLILNSSCEELLRKEMFNEIENQLRDLRTGKCDAKRVLIIVPASATLKTEEECFRHFKEVGFLDLLVMSGEKLRDEIQKECGYPGTLPISKIGRGLLLRKIAKDNKDSLLAFKKSYNKQGFLDLAGDFLVQLKQNEQTLSDISSLIEKSDSDSILKNKLTDMQLVCSNYEAQARGRFLDSDDVLSFCINEIPNSSYIKESIIWLSDFYSFTKHEYSFLSALAKQAQSFNAAILADSNEFRVGMKTAQKLASIKDGLVLRTAGEKEEAGPKRTAVCECNSPYTRSYTIAADILRKIRDENLSYSDFLVLCGGEDAQQSVKTVLSSLSIPVYFDTKRSVLHTAPSQYLVSALNIAVYGFRRKDVLAFIKSGLFDEPVEDLYAFENYLVQYKIFDKAFRSPFKYGEKSVGETEFKKLEDIRIKLTNLLGPFIESFGKAKTISEKTRTVYEFLAIQSEINIKIDEVASKLLENGFVDASQELSQSYDAIISVLEQFTSLIGNEEMEALEYAELLENSLADVKIGILPQQNNAVRIGTISRSSFESCNTLYIADFNDGIIPSDANLNLLLTQAEIEKLEESGISLFKTSKTLADEEKYQIFRTLRTKCKELIVMYTECDKDANPILPSSMLAELKGCETIGDISKDEKLLSYLQDKEMTFSSLPYVLKKAYLGNDIPEEWKIAYNLLLENEKTKTIADSIFYKPGEPELSKDIVNRLLVKADGSYFSPTELEKYASCPFKHFINFDIQADEQRVFDIDAAAAGSVYHEVLCNISRELDARCKDQGLHPSDIGSPWKIIEDEEIIELVDKYLLDCKDVQSGLLSSNPENEYKTSRLRESCILYAKYMIDQVRKGSVSEMFFEQHFGEDKDGSLGLSFPAVYIDTPYGKARIEGKIDRVDILNCDKEKYVKIIDYKSGDKSFNKAKFESCLDLQLIVYLEGALGQSKELKPAGVFYYLIHDIGFEKKDISILEEDLSESLSSEIAKNFALDGVVVDNPAVLKSIDNQIIVSDKGTATTDVFKAGKGQYNRLISEEEMNSLRDSVKTGLEGICSSIFQGIISPKPAFFNGKNYGCEFCTYSSICLYRIK